MSLEDLIASTVKEAIRDALASQPPLDLFEGSGIEPGRIYSTREVAQILGTRRTESICEIPESLLPRVRRLGRKQGFMGINILCYIHNIEPVDTAAWTRQLKGSLSSKRSSSHRANLTQKRAGTSAMSYRLKHSPNYFIRCKNLPGYGDTRQISSGVRKKRLADQMETLLRTIAIRALEDPSWYVLLDALCKERTIKPATLLRYHNQGNLDELKRSLTDPSLDEAIAQFEEGMPAYAPGQGGPSNAAAVCAGASATGRPRWQADHDPLHKGREGWTKTKLGKKADAQSHIEDDPLPQGKRPQKRCLRRCRLCR